MAFPFADKSVLPSTISSLSTFVSSKALTLEAGFRFGRKPSLLVAALFGLVGGLMQAAASGILSVLYVGRVVEGLGLGAATMLTPVYISE